MFPPIISFPTIFFTTSILVLISTSISPVQCRNLNIAPTPSSPNYSTLETICTVALIDEHLCLEVLQSIPKIAYAIDLQNLLIAITESGISNSTNTRTYIEAALNQTDTPALNECMMAYDQVVNLFSDALGEILDREYVAPLLELLLASTDYVKLCDDAMAKQNVKDEVISRGNIVVPIFGLSALSTVNLLLDDQSRVPPPPQA